MRIWSGKVKHDPAQPSPFFDFELESGKNWLEKKLSKVKTLTLKWYVFSPNAPVEYEENCRELNITSRSFVLNPFSCSNHAILSRIYNFLISYRVN